MMEIGVAHLLEASIKLECSFEVTTRALFLYHRFMKRMGFYYFDEDLAAAGALRISGRVHGQPIDINSLICVFYSITNQTLDVLSYDDADYKEMRQSFNYVGWMMFRGLWKDFNKPLAHQYLLPLLTMIFERSKNIAEYRAELGSTCLRFINDLYTQRVCLSFPPELIAVACIDLGLYIHGLINDLAMIPPWYMGFVSYIDPDMVKSLKQRIMTMYLYPLIVHPRPCLKYLIVNDGQSIRVIEIRDSKSLEQSAPVEVEAQPTSEEVEGLTAPKEVEELTTLEEIQLPIPEGVQQPTPEVQQVVSTIQQVATEVAQIVDDDDIYR